MKIQQLAQYYSSFFIVTLHTPDYSYSLAKNAPNELRGLIEKQGKVTATTLRLMHEAMLHASNAERREPEPDALLYSIVDWMLQNISSISYIVKATKQLPLETDPIKIYALAQKNYKIQLLKQVKAFLSRQAKVQSNVIKLRAA